jgi:hypothetical protein
VWTGSVLEVVSGRMKGRFILRCRRRRRRVGFCGWLDQGREKTERKKAGVGEVGRR